MVDLCFGYVVIVCVSEGEWCIDFFVYDCGVLFGYFYVWVEVWDVVIVCEEKCGVVVL